MNGEQYCKVVKKVAKPYMVKTFRRGKGRMMHDLAPCHRAKIVTALLNRLRFKMLEWPSNAPDMNPIENVWRVLKKMIAKWLRNPANRQKFHRFKDIDLLKMALTECWNSEEINRIAINCCIGMPRRIDALVKAKGKWTKY